MKCLGFGWALGAVLVLVACGDAENYGGRPGDAAGSGGGSGSGAGGTSTGGGSGAPTGPVSSDQLPFGTSIDCAEGTFACNGSCLAQGETVDGCTNVLSSHAATWGTVLGEHIYYSAMGENLGLRALERIHLGTGAVEVIVDGLTATDQPKNDGTSIFLRPFSSGPIEAVNVTTAEIRTVVAESNDPVDFQFVGGNLYYREDDFRAAAVTVAPVDGSAAATQFGPDATSIALFVDSTHVYWAAEDTSLSTGSTGQLKRAPLGDGSAVENLLAVVPKGALLGNSTHLFYADGWSVYAIAKSGGEPTAIYQGEGDARVLAVDEAGVYVYRSPPDDAPPEVTSVVTRIGLDGAGVNVFYGDGAVYSAELVDGTLYIPSPFGPIWAIDVPE